MVARLVVLASGAGTTLHAFLDAARDGYPAQVVGVGSDRANAPALRRAAEAGIDTFAVELAGCADRAEFDRRTATAVAAYDPDLVVLAGYMKILGPAVLERFPGRILNTHAALLPAFPGAHPVRDALAYGVKVTGATVHFVEERVDQGPIVAQVAVPVAPDDDEATLHARIKAAEAPLYVASVARLLANGWRITGRTVCCP